MRRQRFTQEQVIGALRSMRGLTTLAARELGCDPKTVYHYCQRYPRVREALGAARAQQLDVAEAQLFKAVDRGELPAIMFLLRTIGRSRGYGDHVAIDAQVDVLQTPGWLETRAALFEVLRAFPEALGAVEGRLRALAAPQDEGVDNYQDPR